MHERWETLGPETLDSIRDAEGVPHEAVSASVSLDGVMVPLRAGEERAGPNRIVIESDSGSVRGLLGNRPVGSDGFQKEQRQCPRVIL